MQSPVWVVIPTYNEADNVEGIVRATNAELTGIAVGTSKAQLFRARRLLREALNR